MIGFGVHGPELSGDIRFGSRVRRLAGVSSLALGVVFGLATVGDVGPAEVRIALAAGWFLMPTILYASLWRPALRYLLIVPASLVSVALAAIVGWALPADVETRLGWILLTAGILVGGSLGLWFWYRLMPVPGALEDPFGPGRWALIALHVALVVWGLVLIGLTLA